MTLPAPELGLMKQDMSGLIVDWGTSATIFRKGTTKNAAGQVSASFATVGVDVLWIQPVDSKMFVMDGIMDPGIKDKSDFMCFQKFSGTAMLAEDRLTVAGDSYAYDVISSQIVSTHRLSFLKQVKRS